MSKQRLIDLNLRKTQEIEAHARMTVQGLERKIARGQEELYLANLESQQALREKDRALCEVNRELEETVKEARYAKMQSFEQTRGSLLLDGS